MIVDSLAEQLAQRAGLDPAAWTLWIGLFLRATLVGTAFMGGISLIAMFCIWWERKVAGRMQSRLGPMHTGAWHGWAQSIADGLKLLQKEDLIPAGADRTLYRLAPYLAFAPVFAAFLALPFGPQFTFETGLNIGVLYLLAVLAVEVMGVILAGWSSNSKWAVYGAMREACQMVSYEIPLGLSIIAAVIVAGTLHLGELSYLQGAGLWDWFIFHNPFIFAAFFLYFVASLAANKRAPFDLPESESELVAGFHTEYSGLRWSFFFFAEYGAMFVVGAIQAVLFLGAWNSPLGGFDPVYRLLGYDPVGVGQAYFAGQITGGWTQAAGAMQLGDGWVSLPAPLALLLLNGYCLTLLVGKTLAMIFVQMWLRWTLPRIRIDQVMHACVKVLLPMSLVTLVGAMAWVWLVPQPAAVMARGQEMHRLGHLLSATPFLQLLTQIVLMVLGLAIVGFCLAVVALAYLGRSRQPRQSFFAAALPVGREIAWMGKPAAEAAPPAAAAAVTKELGATS